MFSWALHCLTVFCMKLSSFLRESVRQQAKWEEERKSANEQCVWALCWQQLTPPLPDTHTLTRTHVLGEKCGESSPSVRVVIRLPSINTRGCGGGRAAGVWVYGCASASVFLCMSVFFLCVCKYIIIMFTYTVKWCLCVFALYTNEYVAICNQQTECEWWPQCIDPSVTGTQQHVWTWYKVRENLFKDGFVYTLKVNATQRRKSSSCNVFSVHPDLVFAPHTSQKSKQIHVLHTQRISLLPFQVNQMMWLYTEHETLSTRFESERDIASVTWPL